MSNQEQTNDRWLTPNEMAQIFPLHPSTFLLYIRKGDLKGTRIGRKWFVKRSIFNTWLEKERRNQAYVPTDQQLHEVTGRRLLKPGQVALLLDNGSLALMDSNTVAQITLDAAAVYDLLDLLYNHRDRLYQLVQHGKEEGEQEYLLYWHPSPMYTARLAYGHDTPLWGSERLEVWHEGRWIAGKVGHVGATSGLVLWPAEKAGNPEYIPLTVGSRVRNVSAPAGDGGGPEQ